MPTAPASPRPRRRWLGPLVVLGLFGSYQAVLAGVRWHVDGLVQQSVGKPLPTFRLTDATGAEWTQERLRGRRALLHFFRSYCHSCDAEAPGWRDLETRLPEDVVLLHVSTDVVLKVAPEVTAATIASKRFARPVVLADAAFVAAFHQVAWSNVTPITYVVDAQGTIRYGLRGRQEPAAVEAALAAVR